MKKMNKKGFTLAELLIVVAIIAVLVAIAIPVFSSQLEKSRDAVTVANLRSAYAEAVTAYLGAEDTGNADFTAATDTAKATVKVSKVVAKGAETGFKNDVDKELPFTAPSAMGGTAGTYTVTFTFNSDGTIDGTPTATAASAGDGE